MSHTFPQKRLDRISAGLLLSLGVVCLPLMLAGCGSGSSKPQAGAISVTDPNGIVAGQLTSVSAGQSAKVTLPVTNDPANSGVDWTLFCNGSPFSGGVTGGACGAITPAHTSDVGAAIYTAPGTIPISDNVTIIATVSGSPAATSNVTLPIVPLPITVSTIAGPTSMTVATSATFSASALNDTSGAGVTFNATCGGSPCGSFSNFGRTQATFTAPSSVPVGGSAIIKATSVTNPNASASLTVTIVPPPVSQPVAISLSPSSFYATPTGTTTRSIPLTATVSNDPANLGITWTCTINGTTPCAPVNFSVGTTKNNVATATFTGSATGITSGSTITITAQANADVTQTATAQGIFTTSQVTAIKFSVAPPASLSVGGAPVTLTATSTPASSINWTATCNGMSYGTFSKSPTTSGVQTMYTPPTTIPPCGSVTITAASAVTTPSNSASAIVVIAPPAPTIAFTPMPASSIVATTQAAPSQTPVNATVTNDSTPPGGVTWSLSCSASSVPGGCGFISPVQTPNGISATYTAPPLTSGSLPVTVTATSASTAFNPVSVNSIITVTPSTAASIAFVPSTPSTLGSYAVVNLTASVANDATNAGVDWQLCASGCGFFTIVPGVPAVAPTPTFPNGIPAVPPVTATTVTAWPNGLPIPYTAPLANAPGQTVTLTASAHASSSVTTSATIGIVNALTGPALQGTVQAGMEPVIGASVTLYVAGTGGYASQATALHAPQAGSYGTTDNNGNFTLSAGYQCPSPNSQAYLVATGGKVGANQSNPNLVLMTALGSCSNLSSQSVVINEVTTVASAWSLAPFAANEAITGNINYLYLGTSSSNISGLVNAFASVNNLVDISTGRVRYTVPAGNAAVPYAEINSIANILNTCANSSGGSYNDGSPCGLLFSATAPLGSGGFYNYVAPNDTLQAAFNVAQHPGTGANAAYATDNPFGYTDTFDSLYGSTLPNAPFQPTLTAAPNDFSISLNFTPVGGLNSSSAAANFAIDGVGNLWITDTAGNRVVEWNNQGAPVSPQNGFGAGGIIAPGPIAIDTSGNIWISGSNGLTELTDAGTPAEGSPFMSGSGAIAEAFDGVGNLWATNSTGVMEFNYLGTELSPRDGYVNSVVTGIGPITIDDANNILVGGQQNGPFTISQLNNTNGQLVTQQIVAGAAPTIPAQITADASGNVWNTVDSQLCKTPAYAGLGTINALASCTAGGPYSFGGGGYFASIFNPNGIALDGAGTLWIANTGSPNIGGASVLPNLTEVVPADLSAAKQFAGFIAPSLGAGTEAVAVDSAGNVWVLLANNTITEYVGIAIPAVTPASLAVKNKKIGKTP